MFYRSAPGEWYDGLPSIASNALRRRGYHCRKDVLKDVLSGTLRPGNRDKDGRILTHNYGKLSHDAVVRWLGVGSYQHGEGI